MVGVIRDRRQSIGCQSSNNRQSLLGGFLGSTVLEILSGLYLSDCASTAVVNEGFLSRGEVRWPSFISVSWR